MTISKPKIFRILLPLNVKLIVLLCLVAKDYTLAQESNIDSISYNLPEIVISDYAILVPSQNIVREANTQDFHSWNAHNVAEVLSQSTGMSVQRSSSGDARVLVRGFRHRDILVLFDGIPIASAFEGTIDLNEISIENVTKVKMIKGAPSVIYGTNAMGGVIDIIPKSGLNYNWKHAAFEIGENNTRLLRANYGGRNKFINYFVSANYEATDGFAVSGGFKSQENEDGGIRENSDYSRKNFFLHLNSKINPIGVSSFFFNMSDNERGFPPQGGISDPDFERLTESKRMTFGLSNSFSCIPASLKIFYNRYKSAETTYQDSTYSKIVEVNSAKDYALGAMLYSKLVTSQNNLLILNLSFENDAYKNSSDPESIVDVDVHTYSLAVEDELSIKKKLSIAVGGLISRFDQPQTNKSISALNAQIVIGYQVSHKIDLHASATRRTRFPKLRELYRDRYGNPDLQEQKANNYELGLKFINSQKIQTDLTVFLNKLEDLIDREDRRSLYENLEDVTLKGFEASSGGWLTKRLFGHLGYTYLEADEKFVDGSSRQLRRLPKHNFNVELRYKLPFNIYFSLNGIYVSELFDVDEEQVYTQMPNYFLLNAKTSITIRNLLNAYIAMSNIKDEDYVTRFGYPREGRTTRFGLNLTL